MTILVKYSLLTVYSVVTLLLFEQVFNSTKMVIDEEFHLRQGMHYCQGNFEVWDSKITTFPGLYLLSALFLYPYRICNIFMLRFTSLAASIVNVFLIYEIRSTVLQVERKKMNLMMALDTLTIAVLPPMYFFAHLYYTDISSITTILGMILFSLKSKHNFSAIFGIASVLMRQTNIVWVALILGSSVIDKVVTAIFPQTKIHDIAFKQLLRALNQILRDPKLLFRQLFEVLTSFYGYIFILINFMIFLVNNGSIVVGDKTAHEANLHVPQLFYFSIFFLLFGPSLWLPSVPFLLKSLMKKKFLFLYILMAGTLIMIIQSNSLVHPYLLADNRHYTFYLWNRFYLKYDWAKFAAIPAYIVGLMTIAKAMKSSTIGFKLVFPVAIFLAICLQKLVEIRYFLVPFLFLRLNLKTVSSRNLLIEIFVYLLINGLTFYLFFTKEIKWKNYVEAQRLIW